MGHRRAKVSKFIYDSSEEEEPFARYVAFVFVDVYLFLWSL